MNQIELVILTGFLGAGKTTLLGTFLKDTEANETALLVNEVAQLDFDGAILKASTTVPVTLLSNGCICCSVGTDLAQSVGALMEACATTGRPLKRIVLETSGLARPGPLLRSLASFGDLLRVSIVCAVDCSQAERMIGHREAIEQLAAANRIVLTKLDIASYEQLQEVMRAVTEINPLASIVQETDEHKRALGALAPVADIDGVRPSVSTVAARTIALEPTALARDIRSRVCVFEEALESDVILEWIDNLAASLGSRLLRLKGILRIAGSERPIIVQSVGTFFSPVTYAPQPSDLSFLVVIGVDLSIDDLTGNEPGISFSMEAMGGVGRYANRQTPPTWSGARHSPAH